MLWQPKNPPKKHFLKKAQKPPCQLVGGIYGYEGIPLEVVHGTGKLAEIKRDFAERLEAVGNKDALVDVRWASEFLKG